MTRTGGTFSRSPRGFMTMFVLSTFIFLAAAVVTMTAVFTHESNRTRTALAQTQLRQLLLAAVPEAQAQLRANPAPRDVPLAMPVEGASVVLHISGDTVVVEARLRAFKAAQTLQFENGKLASSSLTQTFGQ